MKMLSKQQALGVHEQLIEQTGGSKGLRDEGMLEFALAAPLFKSFIRLDREHGKNLEIPQIHDLIQIDWIQ